MPPQQSELDLLNDFASNYVETTLTPALSEDEKRDYGRLRGQKAFRFTVESLYERENLLEDKLNGFMAFPLDAIILQALFGRKTMMSYPWFRSIYGRYGHLLDNTPRQPPSEHVKLQDAILGRTSKYQPPQETTTTGDRSTEDRAVSLRSQIEEMNETEPKQHEALEEIFSALAIFYPGLKGVRCGVRHSFRGRDDRCAERKALVGATIEYINEIRSQDSS